MIASESLPSSSEKKKPKLVYSGRSSSSGTNKTARDKAAWGDCLRKAAALKQQKRLFLSTLPASLQEIWAALHDIAQVEKLVSAFGGSTLRIPAQHMPPPNAALRRVIGKEALFKLMQHFGGTLLYVPQCRRFFTQHKHTMIRHEYSRCLANGSSAFAAEQMLALKHNLSNRWVRSIVNNKIQGANRTVQPQA